MLLKELIRFSTQHRALSCYLILSIWIFLLITIMYKYINTNNYKLGVINGKRMVLSISDDENNKYKKYQRECAENISRKDDGGILDGWKLQGVLLVIRHGDRGPMSHVKGIQNINCGAHNGDILLNRYKSFLINSSNPAGTHKVWNKIGPFHSFVLLPDADKACLLGQLTYKGIAQILHLGDILNQIYSRPLGLYLKPSSSKTNINSTPNSFLNSDEIIIFSTRYRRTFQSAMAFMFTFLPQDKWLSLNLHESHSIAFCFSDCICPKVDFFHHHISKLSHQNLAQHSAVSAVVQWIAQSLLYKPLQPADYSIREILDAVFSLICHNATLPCKKIKIKKSKQITTTATTLDQNDVINIDQDEIPAAINININNQENNIDVKEIDYNENNNNNIELNDGCIEHSHIGALMSYANWQVTFLAKHSIYKYHGLLKAYGLIRHIVSYMLKMMSGDRTKFILYSGHEYTIEYLIAALGINKNIGITPYAARLAFEVYRSNLQNDYYFRVIYNGNDVTKQIDFCEGSKSLRVTRDSRGNKADLCPIENIIRFLHDDYFSPLNATNFKDACTPPKN